MYFNVFSIPIKMYLSLFLFKPPFMGKKYRKQIDRALVKADDDSIYAIITKPLGHDKFEVYCSDTITRRASIRGSMRKRVWINTSDIVLCSLREGEANIVDIVLKYTDEEVKTLKEGGHVTEMLLSGGPINSENDGTNIDFTSQKDISFT
ncbi:hypothetical protein NUSPORA_01060 [Nucleospora cyclopteri]